MRISVLIPARNEMFLKNTIEDILKNKRSSTEIIVGLDGQWANPSIIQHPDVNVIYVPQAIGQRAMTNMCAKIARGKYLIKCDAHCSFDEGFDIKLLQGFKQSGDDVVMVPVMRNLWAFDWVCKKCGNSWYQGPTPTYCCSDKKGKTKNEECDSTVFERDVKWIGKTSPQSKSYCFDSEPQFQYFGEWTKSSAYREQLKTGLTETMSLQGSFFMVTKENYWKLKLSDEEFGSWGSQGIEVASKMWLSGGRVLVNHNTWYAHMFRTQGGDFSFPYPQSNRQVQEAKKKAKELFFKGKFKNQTKPLSWLIDKFNPIKGWNDEDLIKLKKEEKCLYTT